MLDLQQILFDELGEGKNTSKGNVAFHCPFCNHRKRKLEVILEADNSKFGYWHCWSCNARGKSVYSLFNQIGNKNPIVLNHIYKQEKQYNKYIVQNNNQKPKVQGLELPSEFIPLHGIKNRTKYVNVILTYLLNRGITPIDIFRYNIGYCETGRYKHRVIIPNYNANGELNFYLGRYIFNHKNVINYLGPKTDKSKIIGFENLINWKLPIHLIEGQYDAITHKNNSIPLYGKTLNDTLLNKIITEQPKIIHIILDKEAIKHAVKIARKLSINLLNTKIYITLLGDEDPNDLGQKKLQAYINSAKEFNDEFLIKYKIHGNPIYK